MLYPKPDYNPLWAWIPALLIVAGIVWAGQSVTFPQEDGSTITVTVDASRRVPAATQPTPEPNDPAPEPIPGPVDLDAELAARISRAADGLWAIADRWGPSNEFVGWPSLRTIDNGTPYWGNEAGTWVDKPVMTIQPPGTPGVGYTMLKVYRITGNLAHLKRAMRVGDTLLDAQKKRGGGWHQDLYWELGKWLYAMGWADGGKPKRWDHANVPASHAINAIDKGAITLDDGTSQAAALFLLRLYQAGGGQRYLDGAKQFGDLLVDLRDCRPSSHPGTAPYAKGGIPQVIPFDVAWQIVFTNEAGTPGEHYYCCITTNDKTISQAVLFLIELFKESNSQQIRDCVRLQIDYLLDRFAAQGNRGWCQQYDWKTGAPAWGRHKEPPAIVSGEHEIPEALLAWYSVETDAARKSRIVACLTAYCKWWRDFAERTSDGRWHRYYGLTDSKPLWADGYKLVDEAHAAKGQPWVLNDPARPIRLLMPEGDELDVSAIPKYVKTYCQPDGIFSIGGANIATVEATQSDSGLWPKDAEISKEKREIANVAANLAALCELCKAAGR